MGRLDLFLLGGFRVRLGRQEIAWFKSDKTRALLAYLAVEAEGPHRREALAALLWPEHSESSARANLSQALYNLRVALGERGRPRPGAQVDRALESAPKPLLLAAREAVQLNPAAEYHLDVAMFESLLAECGEHAHGPGDECDACLRRLGEAATLYRGPFLEGLSVPDSAPFEEWVTIRREQFHRQTLDALSRLAAAHERRGEHDRALPHARRQVELEPWREEGQRQLMRLLALAGQRSAALAQYRACRQVLAEELDAEPAAETTALYEAIRRGAALFAERSQPRQPSSERPGARRQGLPHGDTTEGEAPRVSVPPGAPFVAREEELAHLEAWLEEAIEGRGRVGFVVGEPGSGKTVLLREFARRAMEAHRDLVVAGGACNAYAGLGDAYLPFIEALRLLTGDFEAQRAAGALSREHARRLQEAVPLALEAVVELGPALIDALLRRDALLDRARALPEGAAWEARIHEAISHRPAFSSQGYLHDQGGQVLQAVAASRPLLLILDDLQWADADSITLLFHLARGLAGRPAGVRLLLLGAYRPEEVAAGRDGKPHPLAAVLHELQVLWEDCALDLAQAKGRGFVDALVDREPNRLGPAFREALYRRTGGHALFSVEFLRGLQQGGYLARGGGGAWVEGPSLDWERMPKRVEAVIAAHIARLSREEQEVLAVASIEGEEFHAEVIARILGKNESEVLAALSGPLSQEHRLLRPDSLRRLGGQQFSRYRFRHYLFQHYLYQRLDPVRRAHLHGEVARSLEALGAVYVPHMTMQTIMVDDRSDVLGGPEWVTSDATMAWHWEKAGVPEKAAAYHVWAGRRAVYLSFDYPGIAATYVKALDLLATAPETPERLRWEERSLYMLGWARGTGISWLSPELGRAWQKALDSAERSGDNLLIADALTWLALYRRIRGELDVALSLIERAVALRRGGLPGWMLWIQAHLAQILMDRGEFARAAALLAPLADPLVRTGSVPGPAWNVEIVVGVPAVPWCLGYPDQALQVGKAALELMQRIRERAMVGTDALVICNAILPPQRLRRQVQGVEQGLELVRPIVAERRCRPHIFPIVAFHEGWLHVEQGLLGQGIAEMRHALYQLSRNSLRMRPYYKGLIAEALGRAGRAEEGLILLDGAFKQVERTNERWAEAELHRLRGELLLQGGGDPEEVEGCFRRAISVAQGQEAKSWELRATTSLARLLRGQGRTAEAREALSAIYGWFTEGFDTPDLVEARALLGQLAL